jgi:hypothetical protein
MKKRLTARHVSQVMREASVRGCTMVMTMLR